MVITDKGSLAVLGLGKLGGLLVQAFLERGLLETGQIRATVAHEDRAAQLAERFGIAVGTDNCRAVRDCEIVLISVKPLTMAEVCRQISSQLTPRQLVVSVAASVPTDFIETHLKGDIPVVRAMPNTPCGVGAGMTALCSGRHASPAHVETATHLFETVGRTVQVEEKLMNAVTGLSASGPAFIYVILESLAEAGVKVGLPRDVATLLAAQTTLGASQVALQTGHHPALLKDAVTTPAGCTIDGILELEDGKLRVTLIKAVVKAVERAGELLVS